MFFLGVLYHLRHPLLALDSLRRLTRGNLYVETAVSGSPTEEPTARFFRRNELGGDGTNWFAPTITCLVDWVESSGFVVDRVDHWPSDRPAREYVAAHPAGGPPEFQQLSYEVPLTVTASPLLSEREHLDYDWSVPRDRSKNGRAEICACTIIARNYLPAARVLATSFMAHHPEGRFFVLVLDDPLGEIDPAHEPFEVLGLADLDIERSDLDEMAAAYSVMEFATAVKPWLLAALLRRSLRSVLYIDPDIQVFHSLEDLAAGAEEARNRPHPPCDGSDAHGTAR